MARSIAIALALTLAGSAVAEATSHRLALGVGRFGLKAKDDADLVLDVEYRGPAWRSLFGVYPVGGVFVTDEKGAYGRLGFGRDWDFADVWAVTLTVAAGAYEPGDGKDLGHTVEFRSAIEVSREVGSARLGLSISHLSNASISDRNPGVEIALVTLTLPLGRRSSS